MYVSEKAEFKKQNKNNHLPRNRILKKWLYTLYTEVENVEKMQNQNILQ